MKYIDQFGETGVTGSDRKHLGEAFGLAVAKDGSILLLDSGRNRLLRLDEDLRYVDQFGESGVIGSDREHLDGARGVAVAKDGSILISDYNNFRLIRLSED